MASHIFIIMGQMFLVERTKINDNGKSTIEKSNSINLIGANNSYKSMDIL